MADNNLKKSPERIIVISAHPDDEVIGVGGTIAKYAREGKEIYCIIMSYGESSHLWMKRKYTVKMRVQESKVADYFLGVKKTYFIGLREGNFSDESWERETEGKIAALIGRLKPRKIFTHSPEDLHSDHKATFNITLQAIKLSKQKPDIYVFDVWNPFNLKRSKSPILVVNINQTFSTKIQALKCFESQKVAMLTMYPAVYLRAVLNGFNYSTRFVEIFTKVKADNE